MCFSAKNYKKDNLKQYLNLKELLRDIFVSSNYKKNETICLKYINTFFGFLLGNVFDSFCRFLSKHSYSLNEVLFVIKIFIYSESILGLVGRLSVSNRVRTYHLSRQKQ